MLTHVFQSRTINALKRRVAMLLRNVVRSNDNGCGACWEFNAENCWSGLILYNYLMINGKLCFLCMVNWSVY